MLKADLKVNIEKLKNLKQSDFVGALTGELSKKALEVAKENSRVDTGEMQKGWRRARIGSGKKGGYRIYNTVEHAVYNEYGTVRMSAQPMLGPALDAIRGEIPEKVRKLIEVGAISPVKDSSGGGDE